MSSPRNLSPRGTSARSDDSVQQSLVSIAGLVQPVPHRQLYVGGVVSTELAVVKQLMGLVAALMFVALVLTYTRRSQ